MIGTLESHIERNGEKIPVLLLYQVQKDLKFSFDVFKLHQIKLKKRIPFNKINSDELERFFAEIFEHHDAMKKELVSDFYFSTN